MDPTPCSFPFLLFNIRRWAKNHCLLYNISLFIMNVSSSTYISQKNLRDYGIPWFQDFSFLFLAHSNPICLKLFKNVNIMKAQMKIRCMTLKVIQSHIRSNLYQNFSSTFVYGPILIKFCIYANIMKTQFFHWNIWPKRHFYVTKKFFLSFYF